LTTAEDSEHIIYDVTTAESAREHLSKNLMLTDDSPITIEALRYAILRTAEASRVSSALRSTLHAIAILLKQTERDEMESEMIEVIASKVQRKLELPLSQLSKAASYLEADTMALHSQLDDLDSSAIKQAISNIETTAAKVENSTSALANTSTSYKDALLRTAASASVENPLLDPRITQRMLLQAKQVLVSFEEVMEAKGSLAALKEHAEAMIGILLEKTHTPTPKGTIEIEEVTRMRTGELLFQFNSKEAADWIKHPGVREGFAWAIDPTAYIRDCGYSILAAFVPITFQTDNPAHLQEISSRNRLDGGQIVSARWVKPPSRRPDNQTHTHCILTTLSVETANIIIRDGIYIHGKKVYPTKLRKEPLRCLKCHRWGHKASQCAAEADTCGTCGNAHRTNICEEEDSKWCVSCQSITHASWDRQCPAFLSRCADYDKRNPDNLLRYFPTSETWTHFIAPPPLSKEKRYPARWAANSGPAARPTTQGARTAAQSHQQYLGPTQNRTTKRQRQRTLDEYQVHPAVRTKPLRAQQLNPPHSTSHLGGYSSYNRNNSQATGNFNWADEVEYSELNHAY